MARGVCNCGAVCEVTDHMPVTAVGTHTDPKTNKECDRGHLGAVRFPDPMPEHERPEKPIGGPGVYRPAIPPTLHLDE